MSREPSMGSWESVRTAIEMSPNEARAPNCPGAWIRGNAVVRSAWIQQ